jgi:hypothetical protein
MFSRPCLPAPNDGQFHHRQQQQQQQPRHLSTSQYQQQPKPSPHQQSAMPPQYNTALDRSALHAQGPPGVPELKGMRPVLPGHYLQQHRQPSQSAVRAQLPRPAYHDRVPAVGQRHGLRPAMAHTSLPEDIVCRGSAQSAAAPPPSALHSHSGIGVPVAGFPRPPPPRIPYDNKQPTEQRPEPAGARPPGPGAQPTGPGAHQPGPGPDDARPPCEFRCDTCGRPALFVCSACKRVPYCSGECQVHTSCYKLQRPNSVRLCNYNNDVEFMS